MTNTLKGIAVLLLFQNVACVDTAEQNNFKKQLNPTDSVKLKSDKKKKKKRNKNKNEKKKIKTKTKNSHLSSWRFLLVINVFIIFKSFYS